MLKIVLIVLRLLLFHVNCRFELLYGRILVGIELCLKIDLGEGFDFTELSPSPS